MMNPSIAGGHAGDRKVPVGKMGDMAADGATVPAPIRGNEFALARLPSSANVSSVAVIFLPGDGGWRGTAVAMGRTIASWGYDVYGFDTKKYLAAFTISGAFGGLAGILLANEGAYVSPAMMSWMKSGDLIVIVVLGGMGTLFGPLYGTIAFFVLEEALPPLLNLAHKGWGEYWMIVFGPLLVLIALYARGGIDSLLGRRHE